MALQSPAFAELSEEQKRLWPLEQIFLRLKNLVCRGGVACVYDDISLRFIAQHDQLMNFINKYSGKQKKLHHAE